MAGVGLALAYAEWLSMLLDPHAGEEVLAVGFAPRACANVKEM